jgi:hypothetical protein
MTNEEMVRRRDERREMIRHNNSGSVGNTAWKIVGGAVLTLAAAAIIVSIPDIKRYIRISTM